MKFGNFEIPPKNKEENGKEILSNTEISPSLILSNAIDKDGDIINCSDLFDSLLYEELRKKMGKDKFSDFYENSLLSDTELPSPFFWKNLELRDKFIQLIDSNFFKKDIEKIIAIQLIKDVNGVLFAETDDSRNQDLFKIKDLIKMFNDERSTILEKSLLKETVYDIVENEVPYRDKEKTERELSSIEKEIGKISKLENLYDGKLSQFKFYFNDIQKELLINDSKNIKGRNSSYLEEDNENLLSHVEINNIKAQELDPWSLEHFYVSGDYLNSYIAPNILGVYGRSGKLVGWQEVENLSVNKLNKIKNFSEVKEKIPALSSKDMALFKISSSLNFRKDIEEYLDIDLSKIDLKTQFYFLNFIQGKTEGDLADFKKFIQESSTENDKENKFKTFLSIEQGGKKMGDKILTFGEKLPQGIAEKLFAKYGDIVDNVNKITDFTQNNFTNKIETNPELIKKIEGTLYKNGEQLLSKVFDDIKDDKEVDSENILKQLNRINADTITTLAIFKQAVKNGEKLPIESIEGSIFAKKGAEQFSVEQVSEMSELYDLNYKKHLDREFIYKVKEYFKTAFVPESNKHKNYFYTFEKDNKIRAFVRFEEKENKSLYASALNVDEASKNFGLGEAMMDEALNREAEDHILHATCLLTNPSNMRYFEKGFISSNFVDINETRQFDLVWNEVKNKNILAKQISQDELIRMYPGDESKNIEIKKSKTLEELHKEMLREKSLVRCFFNKESNEWFAVYEKVPEDYALNSSLDK